MISLACYLHNGYLLLLCLNLHPPCTHCKALSLTIEVSLVNRLLLSTSYINDFPSHSTNLSLGTFKLLLNLSSNSCWFFLSWDLWVYGHNHYSLHHQHLCVPISILNFLAFLPLPPSSSTTNLSPYSPPSCPSTVRTSTSLLVLWLLLISLSP